MIGGDSDRALRKQSLVPAAVSVSVAENQDVAGTSAYVNADEQTVVLKRYFFVMAYEQTASLSVWDLIFLSLTPSIGVSRKSLNILLMLFLSLPLMALGYDQNRFSGLRSASNKSAQIMTQSVFMKDFFSSLPFVSESHFMLLYSSPALVFMKFSLISLTAMFVSFTGTPPISSFSFWPKRYIGCCANGART